MNQRTKLFQSLMMIPCLWLFACDTLMTETPTAGDDFESPFDGLSHDLNVQFLEGDENFGRVFTVEEGLGPIFNNVGLRGLSPRRRSGHGRAWVRPLQHWE